MEQWFYQDVFFTLFRKATKLQHSPARNRLVELGPTGAPNASAVGENWQFSINISGTVYDRDGVTEG